MNVSWWAVVVIGCVVAVDMAAATRTAARLFPRATRRADGAVRGPLTWLLVGLVRLYRAGSSGRNAGMCRFEPSCSAYALEALGRFGGVCGGALVVYRLARCQPLCSGGYDPVPSRREHSRMIHVAAAPEPPAVAGSSDTACDGGNGTGTDGAAHAGTPAVEPAASARPAPSITADYRLGTRA